MNKQENLDAGLESVLTRLASSHPKVRKNNMIIRGTIGQATIQGVIPMRDDVAPSAFGESEE